MSSDDEKQVGGKASIKVVRSENFWQSDSDERSETNEDQVWAVKEQELRKRRDEVLWREHWNASRASVWRQEWIKEKIKEKGLRNWVEEDCWAPWVGAGLGLWLENNEQIRLGMGKGKLVVWDGFLEGELRRMFHFLFKNLGHSKGIDLKWLKQMCQDSRVQKEIDRHWKLTGGGNWVNSWWTARVLESLEDDSSNQDVWTILLDPVAMGLGRKELKKGKQIQEEWNKNLYEKEIWRKIVGSKAGAVVYNKIYEKIKNNENWMQSWMLMLERGGLHQIAGRWSIEEINAANWPKELKIKWEECRGIVKLETLIEKVIKRNAKVEGLLDKINLGAWGPIDMKSEDLWKTAIENQWGDAGMWKSWKEETDFKAILKENKEKEHQEAAIILKWMEQFEKENDPKHWIEAWRKEKQSLKKRLEADKLIENKPIRRL